MHAVPGAGAAGDGLSSLDFAEAARRLGQTCGRLRLICPAFRSPGGEGSGRTLRRRPDGSVLVSVAIRRRPPISVLADMVDGVLAANGLVGHVELRDELWLALAPLAVPAGTDPVSAVA